MAIMRTLGAQTIDCGKCGNAHEVAIFQRYDGSVYHRCPKEDGSIVEVSGTLLQSLIDYRRAWFLTERPAIALELKRERAALRPA